MLLNENCIADLAGAVMPAAPVDKPDNTPLKTDGVLRKQDTRSTAWVVFSVLSLLLCLQTNLLYAQNPLVPIPGLGGGNSNSAAQPVVGAPPVKPAATPPASSTPETGLLNTGPTAESLQQQIATLEKEEGLEAAVKEQALQAYRSALEALQKVTAYTQRTQENLEKIQSIPQTAANLQKDLEALPEQNPVGIGATADVKDLEQALTQATAEMRSFELGRSRAEQTSTQRPNDRKLLVELQASHPNRLKELQDRMAATPDASTSPVVTRAVNENLQAQLLLLNKESEAIKEELNRFDVERNNRVIALELELWVRRVALQQKKIEALQQLLANRKREQTQNQLMELKGQENDRTYHVLQPHLDEIANYTEQVQKLLDRSQELQNESTYVRKLLNEVSTNERDTRDKEKSKAGDTEAFALSLLRQLYELPDVDSYHEKIRQHNLQMGEATFQQIELRAQARKLINLDQAVEDALELAKQELEMADLGLFEEGLRNNLKRLLTQKRDAIEDLESAFSKYLETLTTISTDETALVKNVEDYRNFIRTRIFWVRSDKALQLSDLSPTRHLEGISNRWQEVQPVLQTLFRDLKSGSFVNILGLSLWGILMLLGLQARRELKALSEQARKSHISHIFPTLRAILLTVVIAAPGPLLVWFFGWRMEHLPGKSHAQVVLASSLMLMGQVYGCLEFFRQLCRPDGVVDAHFNGANFLSTRFRKDYFLAMWLLLPLFFVVTFLGGMATDQNRLTGERILFCVGMLISAYFAQRTLYPSSPLMRELFLMKQMQMLSQTRWLWYPGMSIFFAILAGMAWMGYYYTASQLSWRITQTLLLLGTVLFFWGLALRWYRMAQRWFRIYVLRERMRQPVEEAPTLEGKLLKLEPQAERRDEDREKQTLKLINYGALVPLVLGLWLIWSDVLPAVAFLDEFEFWQTHVQRAVEQSDGSMLVQTVSDSITPINLMVAAFISVITVFLSKNMPGMVDFVVLQRVGIDASLRYALTSVISYLLTFIGFSYAFSTLGFRWEQIQWLAAALTFGLSFGLQEIFANFVSGLIILFERPVRIGDIVTIEGVTGVVTRIQIRASTITDWDRKEFLVPNKELVTGRVLNWTLSDTLNRVVIPVGVNYGADTERAREILFEIANSDPELLKDPGPVVVIEAFGESRLNFALRAFLASLDKRAETIHRLHAQIHKRFREEKIEIAVPQQNLNIRSIPDGWKQVLQEHAELSHDKGISLPNDLKNELLR